MLIDSDDKYEELSVVKEMIQWWEKKRLIYNLIIVSLSIFLIYSFWDYPARKIIGGFTLIVEGFVFIIMANVFYCLSWALGVAGHYAYKRRGSTIAGRWFYFIIGMLFSILATNLYFAMQFDVLFAF